MVGDGDVGGGRREERWNYGTWWNIEFDAFLAGREVEHTFFWREERWNKTTFQLHNTIASILISSHPSHLSLSSKGKVLSASRGASI